jgi:hypothetical protein
VIDKPYGVRIAINPGECHPPPSFLEGNFGTVRISLLNQGDSQRMLLGEKGRLNRKFRLTGKNGTI